MSARLNEICLDKSDSIIIRPFSNYEGSLHIRLTASGKLEVAGPVNWNKRTFIVCPEGWVETAESKKLALETARAKLANSTGLPRKRKPEA